MMSPCQGLHCEPEPQAKTPSPLPLPLESCSSEALGDPFLPETPSLALLASLVETGVSMETTTPAPPQSLTITWAEKLEV